MSVPTRDHLWTNHEVRLIKDLVTTGEIIFKLNLVVGPEVVPGRHMQCLIL